MRDHDSKQDSLRRRTLLVLALATAISSAGLAAGGTAGALLGVELAGTEAAAGLPLGLLVVGQAAAALLISRQTVRVGRSRGLALGYLLGAAGAAVVVFAAWVGSLAVFPALSVAGTVIAATAILALAFARRTV